MRTLLETKKQEIQIQAEYRALLEGGQSAPQIQSYSQPGIQATVAPMSVKISDAQIQQDVVTISVGMGNLTGEDEQCDFLIEQEDRLVNEGYSSELAHATIKKAVNMAANR
jgi:hypothetical protein